MFVCVLTHEHLMQMCACMSLCLNLAHKHDVLMNTVVDVVSQINFLACQLFALTLGFPYRTVLGPHQTSPATRHLVQILVGVPLAYFCFGRYITADRANHHHHHHHHHRHLFTQVTQVKRKKCKNITISVALFLYAAEERVMH